MIQTLEFSRGPTLRFVGTNQGDGYMQQANSMQVNFKNSAASPDIDSSSSFGGAH